MKIKKVVCFLMAIFIIAGFAQAACAESILTDGEFSDWEDKPHMDDVQGDEEEKSDIIRVGWFPDSGDGNLYLYCERLNGYNEDEVKDNKKNPHAEDWELDVYISGSEGNRSVHLEYHPESRRVQVSLVDENGQYLWSAHGKWGDDKYTGKRIEFYIPLQYIVGAMPGGYEINLSFGSGSDRIPDSGFITVSTISTFPYHTAAVLVALAAASLLFFMLRAKTKPGMRDVGKIFYVCFKKGRGI